MCNSSIRFLIFHNLKTFKPAIFPAIAWLIISTILLTIPGSAFPKENFLDKLYFDKWVHIGLFAIMVFLFCWSFSKKSISGKQLNKIFIIIFSLAVVYGITMEFVQKYFIANRGFESGDIIADTLGAGLGLIFCIRKYIKK